MRREEFPQMPIRSRFVNICALFGLLATVVPTPFAAEGAPVSFTTEIRPLISEKCFTCHGPDRKKRKGDLRLDTRAGVEDSGIIVPRNPEESEFVKRLFTADPDEAMPPPDSNLVLSNSEKTLLRQWIAEGAEYEEHWAFAPLAKPSFPGGTEGRDRPENPIDRFVAARLRDEGLEFAPEADRPTLVRRVTLDLTGLPPAPEAVAKFVAAPDPDAYEKLVDELLRSRHYGERMALPWLDAARYADSNGFQQDGDRHQYIWRDWVARAMNDNLPFDQFTVWQLAGDLLENPTEDQLIATGFNRNHMINGEGGRIAEENRVDYVMDMTETMGTVWLGLTLNCCRCHDHKFDPVTKEDYYRFTAFFNQTPVTGAGGNPQTPPILEVAPPEAVAARDAARERRNETKAALDKAAKDFDAAPDNGKEPFRVPKEAAEKALADAEAKLKRLEAAVPKVMVMADQKEPRKTFLLDRGLYNAPGKEVIAGVPAVLLPAPEAKTRLDLARWLVSREHPLTARVAVNRIWQMLFGVGLVKTAEDFGLQSEYPVQRDLLDWLAAEYIESGWDTKALIKTIVTSETYRRSATIASPSDYERDPGNLLLARGARFRMPSWMIRDQALAVSGLLVNEIGGAPVYPYQPSGIWDEATLGKKTYPEGTGSSLHRRSLYTFWRRIVGPTEFFDTAKRQVCEVKPLRTNTPMHALTTLNSPTYVESAKFLAENVLRTDPDETIRFRTLARRLLARSPREEELSVWSRSLGRARQSFAEDPGAAKRFLAIGESGMSPDLDPAEHAAWTALCLNLLNLDETLTKE